MPQLPFVFVLIILYSLYLEYDRPLIPTPPGKPARWRSSATATRRPLAATPSQSQIEINSCCYCMTEQDDVQHIPTYLVAAVCQLQQGVILSEDVTAERMIVLTFEMFSSKIKWTFILALFFSPFLVSYAYVDCSSVLTA
ncbi:hypothetical protein BDD12DRAFT_179350 [Trichophaea hybrida]|nr:hypothetical protein BDD12DRAFT_179350 [Trichophaea hybrida]